MTDPRYLYTIDFAIKGHVDIVAANAEEAQQKFDRYTAEELIKDGYDDIEVDEPLRKAEK